jgi:hypothetical protein
MLWGGVLSVVIYLVKSNLLAWAGIDVDMDIELDVILRGGVHSWHDYEREFVSNGEEYPASSKERANCQ